MINEMPGDIYVKADRDRFDQILFNLISNAVKFTDTGSVKATAQVLGDMVEIGIHDTGMGIPEDSQQDIFLSFEQGDKSVQNTYGGYGLGLSITKSLVELHGGSIRVESEPGSGSSFYFTLSLSQEQEPELPREEVPATDDIMPANIAVEFPYKAINEGHHILVVDDDPTNLYTALMLLKEEGYSVTAVTSGKEAFDIIEKEQNLSLMVLDVMMPDISGFDLCKEIRKSKSSYELPILMLTARNATADTVRGMETGANDYITKPFEMEEFLARVKTLVHLKASVDQALASELAFLQAQIKPHFFIQYSQYHRLHIQA